eukprot:COSAG02_NODE_2049_length_10007_cov_226.930057_2_plen_52_part_00
MPVELQRVLDRHKDYDEIHGGAGDFHGGAWCQCSMTDIPLDDLPLMDELGS